MLPNGTMGECFAAEALKNDGYSILARNFSTRRGEIDLIAAKDGIIAFVEVKTRAANSISSPAAAVTLTKQRRILRTASMYLAQHPAELQPRFDVFEVVTARSGDFQVISAEHLEGAFDLNEANRPR